jgi:hypothetical protein
MTTLRPFRPDIWIVLVTQCGTWGCSDGAEKEPEYETVCTLIGCEDSFALEFETRLRLGDYRATISTPQGSTVCEYAVVDEMHLGIPVFDCEGDIDAAVSDRHVSVSGTPTEVSVRIEHVDSGTVVEQTYLPEYVEERPNGPNCEPLCRIAIDAFPWKGHEDPFICAEEELVHAIRSETDWPEVVDAIAGETNLCTACPNAAQKCIERGQCWNANVVFEGSPGASIDDATWECYALGYCLQAELGVNVDAQCPALGTYD